eukprot:SAG31_NODE_14212_length_820_cov_1.633842_1_plen_63_part_10
MHSVRESCPNRSIIKLLEEVAQTTLLEKDKDQREIEDPAFPSQEFYDRSRQRSAGVSKNLASE